MREESVIPGAPKEVARIVDSAGSRDITGGRSPARFELRLLTTDSTEVRVRVAIWIDGNLELVEGVTPFIRALRGTTCIALVNSESRVEAQLWSDKYGDFRMISGFVGRAGYVIERNVRTGGSVAAAHEPGPARP